MSIEASNWAWKQSSNKGMSPGRTLVLLALADHADSEGVCWPGQEGVAAKTGLARTSVNRMCKWLEAAGYLEMEGRPGTGIGRNANRYKLRILGRVTSEHSAQIAQGQSDICAGQSDICAGQSAQRAHDPSLNHHLTHTTTSSEPSEEVPERIVICIPTNRYLTSQEEVAITNTKFDEWQESFSGVDVHNTLKAIRQWALDNPTRRKTKGGMYKHIGAWLNREQDKGGPRNGPQPTGPGGPPNNSALDRVIAANRPRLGGAD